MNLPSLPQTPTDNLYKFMAIFGLTLLIVGNVIPIYIGYIQRTNTAEAMARIRAIDREMVISGSFDIFKVEDYSALTSEEREKIDVKRKDFIIKNGQAIDELNKLTATDFTFIIIFIFSFVMAGTGIWLIREGFTLWYKRLQKYQDIIIRNEARASRRKLASQDNRKQKENTEKANSVEKAEGIENE